MRRNSRNSDKNAAEIPKLFRIPTVNHSYGADGAMRMITPCLLATINLHPSVPHLRPRILQVSQVLRLSEDFGIAVTYGPPVRNGSATRANDYE